MRILSIFVLAASLHAAGLSSLTTSASNLSSGNSATITATLAAPAGGGGQTVAITYSSMGNLSAHPATISVSSGATTGTMTVTAATLSSNSIVAITGDDSKTVNVALNAPYTPAYPIKLCLTPSNASGTCADTSYLKVTTSFVDRYLTVLTSINRSAKDPATAMAPHFGNIGGANNYYLLRPDVSVIPSGSTINAASLKIKTYTWYTTGDLMAVRRILDPNSLAGGCASCATTGWSTLGTADLSLAYTGATAAFRNHTGPGAGTKWRTSDASSDIDQIQNSLQTADDTQTIGAAAHIYSWNVAASITAWLGGAVNQGWAVYTTNTTANGSVYGVNNSNNQTELAVQFTPANGADATRPATITDLGVSCVVVACTLAWTAPSDNTAAVAYDIRYSTAPITDANFLSASPTSGLGLVTPTPAASGTPEVATFTAPEAITIYFAVRSRDALQNWSPASNSPSLTTANPRGVISARPRMFWQSQDAYLTSMTRLQALVAKATNSGACTLGSGCATAAANFSTMRSLVDFGMTCTRSGAATSACARGAMAGATDLMGVTFPLEVVELYLVLRNSDVTSANIYADAVIGTMTTPTATSMLGYNWAYQGPIAQTGAAGLEAMAYAILYDGLHDRIVERDAGTDPGLKAALLTRAHTIMDGLNQANFTRVREGEYHNYSLPWWSGKTMMAAAVYGDDPAAGTWMAEAAGLMGIDTGGWPWNPTGYSNGGAPETFTFNMQRAVADLTEGAMNWEGAEYWKNAASPALWGVEAYDSATNRARDLFNPSTGLFGNVYKSGLWRVYMNRPDNRYSGIGDAHDKAASGKDQVTLALIEDRFATFVENGLVPAQYIKTFLDTAATGAPWGVGGGGSDGFAWKLMLYDYGAVTAAPYSDLPPSRNFGKDVIMRSGWGVNDVHMNFYGGFTGQYHAHLDSGGFTMFRNGNLVMNGGIYSTSTYWYFHGYYQRSIAGNVPLVYKAGECWKDNTSTCGLSTNAFAMTNDGGQRWPWRRYNPPFSGGFASNEFQINRLWAATSLTSAAPDYLEQMWFGLPKFKSYSWVDHATLDNTKAYTNAYSGQGDNTDVRVANAPDSARREIAFIRDGSSNAFVVMFDKVVAASASYPKSWLLHSANVPNINTGSTVTPAAGINSYSGVNYTSTDTGAARLFNTPLLPASKSVRVVGGNSCAPITISSVSSPGTGQPAVFTTSAPHGLVNGEWLATAPSGCSNPAGQWCTTYGASVWNTLVGGFQVFNATSTTFSMTHAGARDVVADGVSPNPTVASFSAAFPSGIPITYHTNCGFEAYVDDYYSTPANNKDFTAMVHNGGQNFPPGVQTNLWWPANEATPWTAAGITIPRWRYEIKPSVPATTDYFLNVMHPTDTGTSMPAPAALITASGYYGAQIAGAAATYVTMFSTSATPQSSVSYSATHSGAGSHMVSGLAPGSYSVTQGGVQIATPTAGPDGSITFTETGGGTFSISPRDIPWPPPPTIATVSPLTSGQVAVAYTATLSAVDGTPPYRWSITAGSLPAGLSLNTSTGVISGTPTTVQEASFTVQVTDSGALTASRVLAIVVTEQVVVYTLSAEAKALGTVATVTAGKTGLLADTICTCRLVDVNGATVATASSPSAYVRRRFVFTGLILGATYTAFPTCGSDLGVVTVSTLATAFSGARSVSVAATPRAAEIAAGVDTMRVYWRYVGDAAYSTIDVAVAAPGRVTATWTANAESVLECYVEWRAGAAPISAGRAPAVMVQ